MPSRKTSRTKYAVGYRRPPKKNQFKAGKSGNPGGRPKGSRNVGALLSQVIRQKVAVTENGRTRHIPALEVMLRKLAERCHARRSAGVEVDFLLMDRYGDFNEPEGDLDVDELLAEDREILERYLKAPLDNATPTTRDFIRGRVEMQVDHRLYQALLRNDFRAFTGKGLCDAHSV